MTNIKLLQEESDFSEEIFKLIKGKKFVGFVVLDDEAGEIFSNNINSKDAIYYLSKAIHFLHEFEMNDYEEKISS